MYKDKYLNRARVGILVSILLIVVAEILIPVRGYALTLSDRSVTISTAIPSAVSTHTFSMDISSSAPIGSIVFKYCSNSPNIHLVCNSPVGMDASGAVLSDQSGNTGFSIDTVDSNANTIVITRPAIAPALIKSIYTFTNITNPSVDNQTAYVRISTYSSVDGSGSYIDNGSVAFSTENSYQVGAYVPPFLTLCVGVTVAQDCSSASGNSLNFGIMTPQQTGALTSQFAASTNDVNGYSIYVLGTTMTSGNNILPALGNPTFVSKGVSEFGLNLRKNTIPNIGLNPSGSGTASPAGVYNLPNQFTFVPGSQMVNSSLSTEYNVMTVSYIEDVSAGQPPGVYSTTLTYLASAQF